MGCIFDKRTDMQGYTMGIRVLIVIIFSLQGCTGSNSVIKTVDKPGDRPDWEAQINNRELGKADFITDELVNLDQWPFLLNEAEVMQDVLYSDKRVVGSCGRFIKQSGEIQRIKAEILVDAAGRVKVVNLLDDAGPCSSRIFDIIKRLEIVPGKKDESYKSTLLVYSFNLNLE